MSSGHSFDDAVKAQSAEIVRHSASRVGCGVKPQHLREQCAQFRIGKSLKLEAENGQHREQSLNARVAEAKR
jgi:hypothetical protein